MPSHSEPLVPASLRPHPARRSTDRPMMDPLEPRTLCARNPAAGSLSNNDYNYVQRVAQVANFELALSDLIADRSTNAAVITLGNTLSRDASTALGSGTSLTGNTVNSIAVLTGASFTTNALAPADSKTISKLTRIAAKGGSSAAFDSAVIQAERQVNTRSLNTARTAARLASSDPNVRLLASARVTAETATRTSLLALTSVPQHGKLTTVEYNFLLNAAESATFQVALNEVIQAKSFNVSVRAFGTTLASDAATAIGSANSASPSIVSITTAANAALNTNTLLPDDAKAIDRLRNMDVSQGNSAAFDTAALAAYRKVNARALAYAQAASLQVGNNPNVTTFGGLRYAAETNLQNALNAISTATVNPAI